MRKVLYFGCIQKEPFSRLLIFNIQLSEQLGGKNIVINAEELKNTSAKHKEVPYAVHISELLKCIEDNSYSIQYSADKKKLKAFCGKFFNNCLYTDYNSPAHSDITYK